MRRRTAPFKATTSSYIIPVGINDHFRCGTCGEPFTEDAMCLQVNHYRSQRGNEDDGFFTYHRKCTPTSPEWTEYDAQCESDDVAAQISLYADRLAAIQIIQQSCFIDLSVDEHGRKCIVYEQ